MVKVTVECNGEVVTREGNLAVVAREFDSFIKEKSLKALI